MHKSLSIAWNLVLLVFVALAFLVALPKVIDTLGNVGNMKPGAFRSSVIMAGFEGIGLLVIVAAGAFSLSTLFWKKTSGFWRALFLGILIAAVVGTCIAIRIARAHGDFVIYSDYLVFLLAVAVIVLPILFFGVGYPVLLVRALRRIRDKS